MQEDNDQKHTAKPTKSVFNIITGETGRLYTGQVNHKIISGN